MFCTLQVLGQRQAVQFLKARFSRVLPQQSADLVSGMLLLQIFSNHLIESGMVRYYRNFFVGRGNNYSLFTLSFFREHTICALKFNTSGLIKSMLARLILFNCLVSGSLPGDVIQ